MEPMEPAEELVFEGIEPSRLDPVDPVDPTRVEAIGSSLMQGREVWQSLHIDLDHLSEAKKSRPNWSMTFSLGGHDISFIQALPVLAEICDVERWLDDDTARGILAQHAPQIGRLYGFMRFVEQHIGQGVALLEDLSKKTGLPALVIDLPPCGTCQGESQIFEDEGNYRIACGGECGAMSGRAKTVERAIAIWRPDLMQNEPHSL